MNYNIYVDESCHLEGDNSSIMCIGYIKTPAKLHIRLAEMLTRIKLCHKTPTEIKWQKFSSSRLELYKELVDFFYAYPIEFRCILIKYKERLNHEDFNNGSPDNYYYKMTYYLLRPNPTDCVYRVFMDIKDTRGKQKLNKIEEIFKNYHRGNSPFVHFQHLQSNDNVFFQLADFFIGAVTYKNRRMSGELEPNPAKDLFVKYLEKKSGYLLHIGTTPWEDKFNIFNHQPKIRE